MGETPRLRLRSLVRRWTVGVVLKGLEGVEAGTEVDGRRLKRMLLDFEGRETLRKQLAQT